AASGGLVGLGVDTVRHALRVAELDAELAAWTAAEPDLMGAPHRAAAPPLPAAPPPRAVPLREGPLERYAHTALLVAAAGFGASLGVTRRPASARGAALAAIPKAPLLAREGFTSTLGFGVARRGVVVADPDALRRLDRIGTVVLDTAALKTGEYLLGDLIALDEDAPTGDLAAAAHRLFDCTVPTRLHRDGDWSLGPVDELLLRGRTGARARTRLVRGGARQVLGLAHRRLLLAVVSVVPEFHEAAGGLVAAARRAGVTVLAAGEEAHASAVRDADGVVDGGEDLAAAVRALQRDGTGVLLLSRDRAALRAADIGAGVTGTDGIPPWGAHVYVGADPVGAITVVEACGAARTSVRRGVWLAQAAAAIGGVMSLTGRPRRSTALGMRTVNEAAALGMAAGVWSAARLLRQPATAAPARYPWHAMSPETVLAKTASGAGGLTAEQVRTRASPQGPAERPSLIRSVVTEVANPLTPVLGAGAALSAAVGAALDAVFIVAVTGLSGLVGGAQRHATDRAVARLRRRSSAMCRVLRDGEEREVPADGLVVGDVVSLTAGDVVPADCRLLEAHRTEADESALTGESLPVLKTVDPVLASDLADRACMLYEGTTLAAGRARAVVVATGEATEAGRAAAGGRGNAPRGGVERRLAQITRTTLPVALGSAAALMAAGLLRGRPIRHTIGAGVALAVASVPEGLPFLVSAAQLAAARRLSARGALLRDPRSIEAAGRADVLCFDKTGTLTHGRISLTAVSANGCCLPVQQLVAEQCAVLAAGLRATPRRHGGRALAHATDRAVAAGAQEAGVDRTTAAEGWKHTSSLPFEPSRGFHATRGRIGSRRMLSVKGAPEEVVQRCATRGGRQLDPAARAELLTESEKLAAEGRRVLAVAERRDAPGGELTTDLVTGLDFLGFLTFADRMRSSAAAALHDLDAAGVHIVMMTGDHPQTAQSTARELGIVDGKQMVTGAELDALDDVALDALLPKVGVVARGTPVHKVRVVQAFQRLGRTVAMTGDGANDAPAIRLADIGIAFSGRATPAARAAADLVITDDRLETVVVALVEGRAMWASVRQALAILVGGNLGEIGFTVLGATLTGSSPLTARQLLLVNLFTDLAPAIAVALRPPRPEALGQLLAEGPDVSLGTALTDETMVRATATALGAGAGWFAALISGRPARARTVALAALVGGQLGQTLVVGWRSTAVLVAVLGSMAALAAIIQTPGVSHFFGCTPLGPVAWTIALSSAVGATGISLLLPLPAARIHARITGANTR
ncbi:cation-translocating P-type ATPase, partial [Streptomyces sp. NPDC001982]|uniref:cation-translocating P-type ATPase n=1 Tax=Streptomyces sp. NPDC001982 TaxID=3154405 RepID=UPI00331DBE84